MSNKPFIIGISGAGSNSGKTSLACSLIRKLSQQWSVAAIKVATSTPDHRCGRTGLACSCLQFDGRMRLLKEFEYTDRPGKDTARFTESGAKPVWWLQNTQDFASQAAKQVLQDLPDTEILIIEGGAFVREGQADVAIAVRRLDDANPKSGFSAALAQADFLLLSDKSGGPPPAETPASEPDVLVFDPEGGEVPGPLIEHIGNKLSGAARR